MKICFIVGTRPQFLKLAPLSKLFPAGVIIHSGQHYDKEMSEDLFDCLGIRKPDYNINTNGNTVLEKLGYMLVEIEKIIIRENIDTIVVFGDCDTTTAGTLVAKKLKKKLIHIEAGMRSYNKDMPEEQNRILTDHLSDLLLCSTKDSIEKLKNEGINKNVYFVGNLQLDLLDICLKNYNKEEILENNNLIKDNFVLLTIHREYNTTAEKLLYIFNELSKLTEKVIFPIHPRTKNVVIQNKIKIPDNIVLIKPVNYLDMTILERFCKYIITDSGGVQPEAMFLGKKCIVMRSETEWLEPIENNNNILYDYKKPLNNFIKDFIKIPIKNNLVRTDASKNIYNIICQNCI